MATIYDFMEYISFPNLHCALEIMNCEAKIQKISCSLSFSLILLLYSLSCDYMDTIINRKGKRKKKGNDLEPKHLMTSQNISNYLDGI